MCVLLKLSLQNLTIPQNRARLYKNIYSPSYCLYLVSDFIWQERLIGVLLLRQALSLTQFILVLTYS